MLISLSCFVIIYLSLRIFITNFLVVKITKSYELIIQENQNVRQKFEGSLWSFFVYLGFFLYGIYSLRREKWIMQPGMYLERMHKEKISKLGRIYYKCEMAYYIASLLILFIEPKLKDFFQMVSHHIITLMLIIGSYNAGEWRYGLAIMFLHDCSDPFLELGKLCYFLRMQKAADVIFLIFTVIFYITRCFVYPIFIVLPALYYTNFPEEQLVMKMLLTNLILLMVLNYVWSIFIYKMIQVYCRNGTLKRGDIEPYKKNMNKVK